MSKTAQIFTYPRLKFFKPLLFKMLNNEKQYETIVITINAYILRKKELFFNKICKLKIFEQGKE